MKSAQLIRTEWTPEGTFGFLEWPGQTEIIFTVELPWKRNEPSVSCIPCGIYRCRPRWYYRGDYAATEVLDVPGRTDILFHRANYPSDLAGCIVVGMAPLRSAANERGVANSRAAWQIFDAAGFLADEWELEISYRYKEDS